MTDKNVYQLNFSFEAPDIYKSKLANKRITKFFPKGSRVIGGNYKKDKVIAEKRYIFPSDYVEKVDEFTYLKRDSSFDDTVKTIKENAVQMSNKEKEKLDNVGEDVKGVVEGTLKKKITNEASSYKSGALVGLAGGVVLALYLNKSVWTFGILGVAIGGYVGNKIYKAKQGKAKNINAQLV